MPEDRDGGSNSTLHLTPLASPQTLSLLSWLSNLSLLSWRPSSHLLRPSPANGRDTLLPPANETEVEAGTVNAQLDILQRLDRLLGQRWVLTFPRPPRTRPLQSANAGFCAGCSPGSQQVCQLGGGQVTVLFSTLSDRTRIPQGQRQHGAQRCVLCLHCVCVCQCVRNRLRAPPAAPSLSLHL